MSVIATSTYQGFLLI